MKRAKPKRGSSGNVFPKKNEARSSSASSEVISDAAPLPELAKTYTAGEAQQIVTMALKPVYQEHIVVGIFGTDLITHKWSEKAMKEMLLNQQRTKEEKKLAKNKREAKDPEAEFQGARYRWDNADWFPANGIKKAMVSAGYDLGIPRSIVRRSVFVAGAERRDYVKIKYARIIKREDAVRVGPFNNRTADLRYRPEYQNWSMDLRIRFRADVISAEQVILLLQNAGFSVGIGEWRPEKDGQAGTFEVEELKAKAKKVRHAAA